MSGAKTFISNGLNADLIVTAVRTGDTGRHDDISVLVIEEGMEGFARGRNLEKLGTHSQDTAELFFDDVFVPAENLLGEEGQGFRYLMRNLAQERLAIAVTAAAGAPRGARSHARVRQGARARSGARSARSRTRASSSPPATPRCR